MEIEYWNDRPKSYLVKWLMQQKKLKGDEAAIVLDVSAQYFANKLVRNSFTFEEIIAIAEVSGYDVEFRAKDDSIDESHAILLASPAMFCDDKLQERINLIDEIREKRKAENDLKEARQIEYLKMKAELAEFKKKYKIKD